VPLHLRNAVTGLMRQMGYGRGYQYAHDYDGHFAAEQTHLPDGLRGRRYYQPGKLGAEALLAERLSSLRGEARGPSAGDSRPAPPGRRSAGPKP